MSTRRRRVLATATRLIEWNRRQWRLRCKPPRRKRGRSGRSAWRCAASLCTWRRGSRGFAPRSCSASRTNCCHKPERQSSPAYRRFRDWVKADVWKRSFDAVSAGSDMVDAAVVKVRRHGQDGRQARSLARGAAHVMDDACPGGERRAPASRKQASRRSCRPRKMDHCAAASEEFLPVEAARSGAGRRFQVSPPHRKPMRQPCTESSAPFDFTEMRPS